MASNPKDTRPMTTTDASHQPQSQADVGGIPANLQHGLFDDGQGNGRPGAPWDGDLAERQVGGGKPPAHIDSPLESIGKAITEPVWDASGEADKSGQPGDRSPPTKKP